MTTQKPELMPDEISLFRCEGEGDIKWSEDSSDALATYVNKDLYTTAIAERDALRALCEGMAGALKEANAIFNNEGWGIYSYMEGRVYEDALNASSSITKALTAYEKHKAGE